MTSSGTREFSGTRTVARKLALQALYRWQLNACPWQDLVHEFDEAEDMARADALRLALAYQFLLLNREEAHSSPRKAAV